MCEHSPSELYVAPVVGIWRETVPEEVSIVDVPANPLARPVDLEIETDALSRAVRQGFFPISLRFAYLTASGRTTDCQSR